VPVNSRPDISNRYIETIRDVASRRKPGLAPGSGGRLEAVWHLVNLLAVHLLAVQLLAVQLLAVRLLAANLLAVQLLVGS
jgi:hypothetical protein